MTSTMKKMNLTNKRCLHIHHLVATLSSFKLEEMSIWPPHKIQQQSGPTSPTANQIQQSLEGKRWSKNLFPRTLTIGKKPKNNAGRRKNSNGGTNLKMDEKITKTLRKQTILTEWINAKDENNFRSNWWTVQQVRNNRSLKCGRRGNKEENHRT